MAFTRENLLKAASLAHLNLGYGLSDAEAEATLAKLTAQMATTVDYISVLTEVDTQGVEPLFTPTEHLAAPREDVAVMHESAEAVLSNAPERQATFYVVPPVLSGS